MAPAKMVLFMPWVVQVHLSYLGADGNSTSKPGPAPEDALKCLKSLDQGVSVIYLIRRNRYYHQRAILRRLWSGNKQPEGLQVLVGGFGSLDRRGGI